VTDPHPRITSVSPGIDGRPVADRRARLRRTRRPEPASRQDRLVIIDDLDRRRQFVGIDPDEHLAMPSPAYVVDR